MNHKANFLAFFLLLFTTASFAQTEKGTFTVAGKSDLNFLFSKITTGSDSVQTGETKATQYNFAIGAGYFIIDNLSIGLTGSWYYNYTRTEASNYLPPHTKSIERRLTILPQLQYYFPLEEKLRPFVAAGAGYAWMEEQNTMVSDNDNEVYNLTGLALAAGGGVAYFITPSVSVELGLQYSYNRLKDKLIPQQVMKDKQLGVNLGVSVFF